MPFLHHIQSTSDPRHSSTKYTRWTEVADVIRGFGPQDLDRICSISKTEVKLYCRCSKCSLEVSGKLNVVAQSIPTVWSWLVAVGLGQCLDGQETGLINDERPPNYGRLFDLRLATIHLDLLVSALKPGQANPLKVSKPHCPSQVGTSVPSVSAPHGCFLSRLGRGSQPQGVGNMLMCTEPPFNL